MPDINPAANDLIEITAHSIGSTAQTMLAKIMTKDPSGKYQVELAGNPIMRGLIDINFYEWSHAIRRWQKRPNKGEAAPLLQGAVSAPKGTTSIRLEDLPHNEMA